MRPVAISGRCQRPGCGRLAVIPGQRVRIDGECFAADPERGVKEGYRLYCSHSAISIDQAINQLVGQKPTDKWPADC
jgi:hypothetical protein